MARPTKPIDLQNGHRTKEEIEARKEAESKLRGSSDKIKPPTYLNVAQKKIFKYIVAEMEASEVLANLDVYILSMLVISIDRMQVIDKKVNADLDLLLDRKLLATRKDCEQAFLRACNELGLSPQSRSKLANINIQAQVDAADPLIQALRDDDI